MTVDVNKHGITTVGIDYVDEVVANYPVNLDLPEERARCSQ